MKKALITLVVTGVGLTVAGYSYLRTGDMVAQVTTVSLTRGDVVDTVGATGALEAVTTVLVGSQVSGIIQELYADFNSIVRRGDVIARLDPSLFETQIGQARANVIRAEAEVERLTVGVADARTQLKRAEGLAARNLIPQSELEAAQVAVEVAEAQLRSSNASLSQAEASLNQSEVNLEHTVITAPIDGIVISRAVDVGQTVAASMQAPTLFVIAADLSKMKVNANIDESDVGRIRPGQRVTFRVDAYPTEEFVGTVSQVRLEPIVVENVVTYATVIDVPNPELKLKPGMTATVTLEIARRDDVLRVPNAALRFQPTEDMFAALNLPVPDVLAAGGRRGGTPADRGASQALAAEDAGPDGEGRGGGDPTRREQFRERMQGLSPEERQAAMARFREGRGGGLAGQALGEAAPADADPDGRPTTERGATTIDALFGPLPTTESRGLVWLWVGGELKPTRVRLGTTDGAYTELLGPEIPEGTELATGVAMAVEAATSPVTGGSPLIPQRPSRRR